MNELKSLAGFIIGFIVGIVPAFFVNFNSLFTDGYSSLSEVLFILGGIIVAYGLLGFVFGILGNKNPLVWAVTLSLPTIIILALYLLHEPQLLKTFTNICFTIGASWMGASLGTRVKTKRKQT